METVRHCALPGCQHTWQVTKFNGHQRFCSRGHQRKAKRMGLGNAEPTEAKPLVISEHKIAKSSAYLPPVQLDIASKWVIDNQKEVIDELKDEKKLLQARIETLTKERNELEKELDKATSEAGKKPSVLNGFLENVVSSPESLTSVLQSVPAILTGLKEMMSSKTAQIEGPNGQQAHALDVWLQQQPEDVRQLFVQMVNNLMRYGTSEELKYILSSLNTQTLRATG